MEELVEISTNLVSSRFFFAYKYLKWLGYVGGGRDRGIFRNRIANNNSRIIYTVYRIEEFRKKAGYYRNICSSDKSQYFYFYLSRVFL